MSEKQLSFEIQADAWTTEDFYLREDTQEVWVRQVCWLLGHSGYAPLEGQPRFETVRRLLRAERRVSRVLLLAKILLPLLKQGYQCTKKYLAAIRPGHAGIQAWEKTVREIGFVVHWYPDQRPRLCPRSDRAQRSVMSESSPIVGQATVVSAQRSDEASDLLTWHFPFAIGTPAQRIKSNYSAEYAFLPRHYQLIGDTCRGTVIEVPRGGSKAGIGAIRRSTIRPPRAPRDGYAPRVANGRLRCLHATDQIGGLRSSQDRRDWANADRNLSGDGQKGYAKGDAFAALSRDEIATLCRGAHLSLLRD